MPAHQEIKNFRVRLNCSVALNYLLFLPESYAQTERTWPLLLFLHGSGERGANVAKVAAHGPPKIVQQRSDFPFIVVSPQCAAGRTWSTEGLLHLLDEVQARYHVDPKRVYLTGLSMGGYGTWHLALKNPERFAAIAPICGGGNLLDVLLPPPGKPSALRRLPVWAFHGAKDPIVPLRETQEMIESLKQLGNRNTRLTIYPEAGHDSWTETYENPELYDWLLRHSLRRNPRK